MSDQDAERERAKRRARRLGYVEQVLTVACFGLGAAAAWIACGLAAALGVLSVGLWVDLYLDAWIRRQR